MPEALSRRALRLGGSLLPGYSWRAAMRVLLVTPPMTQLNTPYPATAYLVGCLRKHAADAVEVAQADSVDRALPAAVLTRRADRGAGRARGGARPRHQEALRLVPVALGDVRRAGRAGRPFSPGPRLEPGHAHRGTRVPARGPALRVARRHDRRSQRRRRRSARAGRSASSASPTAPATWRACSSTMSPTSSVTASIPASSCRATARSSRRARPASIRSPTPSTARRRWSIGCSTTWRATACAPTPLTSSA